MIRAACCLIVLCSVAAAGCGGCRPGLRDLAWRRCRLRAMARWRISQAGSRPCSAERRVGALVARPQPTGADGAARARGRGGRYPSTSSISSGKSDASGHLLADRMLARRGPRRKSADTRGRFRCRGPRRRRLEARCASRASRCVPSIPGSTRGNRFGTAVEFLVRAEAVEPAHAQQDVHRRRPLRGPRRPQHRRPLLRPLRAVRAERPRRHGRGPDGARGHGDVRRLLEQRARVPGDLCFRAIRAMASGGDHAAGAAREHRGERREALARSRSSPRLVGVISKSSSRHSRRRGSEVLWESPEILDEARPRLYDEFKALVASARSRGPDQLAVFHSRRRVSRAAARRSSRAACASSIVTNSLETNNHVVAHTGYQRWRREVLAAGVELYELRADAEALSTVRHAASALRAARAAYESRRRRRRSARSSARRTSIRARWCLNTEIGVVGEAAGVRGARRGAHRARHGAGERVARDDGRRGLAPVDERRRSRAAATRARASVSARSSFS